MWRTRSRSGHAATVRGPISASRHAAVRSAIPSLTRTAKLINCPSRQARPVTNTDRACRGCLASAAERCVGRDRHRRALPDAGRRSGRRGRSGRRRQRERGERAARGDGEPTNHDCLQYRPNERKGADDQNVSRMYRRDKGDCDTMARQVMSGFPDRPAKHSRYVKSIARSGGISWRTVFVVNLGGNPKRGSQLINLIPIGEPEVRSADVPTAGQPARRRDTGPSSAACRCRGPEIRSVSWRTGLDRGDRLSVPSDRRVPQIGQRRCPNMRHRCDDSGFRTLVLADGATASPTAVNATGDNCHDSMIVFDLADKSEPGRNSVQHGDHQPALATDTVIPNEFTAVRRPLREGWSVHSRREWEWSTAPFHSQHIAHRRACGKARVVPENPRPCPGVGVAKCVCCRRPGGAGTR